MGGVDAEPIDPSEAENKNPSLTVGASWFLLCLSLPMFLVFLCFSLKTRVELNWPVTAYLSGAVLLAGWVARQCDSTVLWYRRVARVSLAAAAGMGLVVVLLMHHTEWLYPAVPANSETGIRRWDPTCRLRGWQTLATEVERLRHELRAEGTEPVITASGWALPGEVAFYLPDHPEVHSLALACGGRRSQYDFWRPNPVWDPDAFRGRTFICVGELSPSIRQGFAHVETTQQVTAAVQGQRVATWSVSICRDFQGFPHVNPGGY